MKKPFPLLNLTLVLLAAHTLHAQTLSVDNSSLTFTAQVNGTLTTLPLNVGSSPSSAFVLATPVEQTSPQVPWLTVSPSGGATPLTLEVTVNPSGLIAGKYTGSVVISVQGGNPVSVGVTLTVSTINVNPASLVFQTAVGTTPLVQSVTLTTSQLVTFSASASTITGGNWLQVSPTTGSVAGFGNVIAIPDPTIVPLLSPGTYNGAITITPTSGTTLTPVIVPVALTVTPAPAVTVSPPAVNINYQIGGTANSPQQTVTLSTNSAQGVAFSTSATSQTNPAGGVWVIDSPTSGAIVSSGTPLSIAYNPSANLPAGKWTSTVTVSTPNGAPATTNIPVTLVVSPLPLLNVPTNTLSFSVELGAANPAPQSLVVTSTNSTPQSFVVAVSTTDGNAWLVAPTTGSTSAPIGISVNPAGLAPGNYTGAVMITGVGTGNGTQQVPVTLKVSNDPAIVTDFANLAMPYQLGQTAAVSQAITVSSSNGIPLNFTATASGATCGGSWLALGGATGTTTAQVTVAVNPQGLTPGPCTGTVSIAATSAITGIPAINSPLTVSVLVIVSASSLLEVSPLTPAVFTSQVGGAGEGPLTYTLTSSDSNPLNFTASASTNNGGANWLQVSQTNGQTTKGFNTVGISVLTGQLAAGTYTGNVTISASGPGGGPVANAPLNIPVTFYVTNGSLVLGQTSLSFQQAAGGPPPANQVVHITSSYLPLGFAATAYNSGSVDWLTVSPSGATPGSISVGVNGASLPQGAYTGTVAILATTPNAGNSPAFLTVTLTVNAGTISASPSSFVFTQVQGGPPPPTQTLTVSGTPGAISFQASATTAGGGGWLGISATGGNTSANLQVGISAGNLAVGSYSGSVTIVAQNAGGSPIAVPVTLNVIPSYPLGATPTVITFTAGNAATASQSAQVQLYSSGASASYSIAVSASSWLTVSPTSGNTPVLITATANPSGLAVGAYSGTFTISSPNAVSAVTVTVNLVVGAVAPPTLSAVGNAASYSSGFIAPGENIVIFGSGIGPPVLTKGTVTNGIVDSAAGATRVLFDGVAAPILYAFSTQTSAMVPYGLSGRSITNIVVEYQGVQSSPIALTLALATPGIYTQNAQGSGPGAILNQNYSVNLPGTPASKGSVVAVYMTGEGYTVGAVDGTIATGILSPVLPVSATIGGIPATVVYAGTAPGIITGAMQANVQIPLSAPSGSSLPIVITVGTGAGAVSTQAGVTIAVQ